MKNDSIGRTVAKGTTLLVVILGLYFFVQMTLSSVSQYILYSNLEFARVEKSFSELNNNLMELESLFLNHDAGYIPSPNRIFVLIESNREIMASLQSEKKMFNEDEQQLFGRLVDNSNQLFDILSEYLHQNGTIFNRQIQLKNINERFFVCRLLLIKFKTRIDNRLQKNHDALRLMQLANLVSLMVLMILIVIILVYAYRLRHFIEQKIFLLKQAIRSIPEQDSGSIMVYEADDELRPVVDTLNEMTATIRQQQEKMVQAQKMETIGTLSGGLAHDFNNVLSGITGPVSLLQYLIQQDQFYREEFLHYLATIDHSAIRARGIVDQLLTISRNQDFEQQVLDMNTVIESVIDLARSSFDKSVLVDFSACSEAVYVYADQTRLEQVFLNIMINSSHAMTIMRAEGNPWGGGYQD